MSPAPYADLPQTSFAVLGMLTFSPMSGYDLKQRADRSIGHFYWSPAKSQVYAELRRLARAGLVTEEHVEQETRPDKRVYAITERGREVLADWLDNAELEPDVFKSPLMLRLFFGRSADPQALLRLLTENLESVNRDLADLEDLESQCMDSGSNGDALFSLITIRAGIRLNRAAAEWSRESIMAIQNHFGTSGTGERQ